MKKLLILLFVFYSLLYATAMPVVDFTVKSKTRINSESNLSVLTLGSIISLFPDANLAEAIRLALNSKGVIKATVNETVTQEDLDKIVELRAAGKDIISMVGLQYCSNLYYIDLNDNKISDLNPIKALGIKHLYMDQNLIVDISPLALHTTMSRLSLVNNKITDASVVSNFVRIYDVDLSNNKIKVLPHLTSNDLENVYFNNNEIKDFSPINLWNLNKIIDLELKDQTITLPVQTVVNGAISSSNPIIDTDGTVLNTVSTISNGGIYTTPKVNWINLSESVTECTYQFEKTLPKGSISGTVTLPLARPIIETICVGERIRLDASSTVVNPIYTWYSDAELTAQIANGESYTVSPTVTTVYYVSVQGDAVCENGSGTAKAIQVIVNPKAVATDITIDDATICVGETATLTATSTITNPVFTWYSDATLTTEAHTGDTYDVSPTVTTTYYITVRGDGVCENAVGTAKEVTVIVNSKAVATDITVVDAAICAGETTTLTATSTIVNPIFTWYSDASLTTEISTGSTYDANPTVTTTYYITVSGDGVCANAVGTAKEVTVTVNPKAIATDITVADAAICAGETATLTASSTVVNPIFTWYSDASLTTEISTGSTYDANPTVTTTYYVTVSGDGVCANAVGTAKEVTVTVNPKAVATDITVADVAICAGETATLTAISTIVNPIFTWYSDASLTTEISTGSTYDASPVVTTMYYLTVSGDGVCANAVGTAKQVTVTVNPKAVATDITVADAAICAGETATLTASSTIVNPIFTWYSDASLTTEISTGSTYDASPTVTTTYYVTVSGDGVCANAVGTAKEVTVTVNPKAVATDITAADAAICAGETATLTAISTVVNPIFTWCSDASLTTEISTGSTYDANPTVTTTYYVTVSGDGVCANAVGTAKEVTVTVNPKAVATDITAADAAICTGETATLTATSTIVNPIFTWYSDASLTTEISTGSTYDASPTVTTTYYVTVSGDGVCANAVGTAKEVTVTVNPKAIATDITVADAAICAGETATLTASSTIVNPVFTWYSDASLTTEISTGSTYDANPIVTTTYYVTVSGDGVCANAVGTAKEVTVTVNPKAVATDITVADAAICAGETATLTATSTVVNPIFTWYSDASLTTEISTGSTYDASPTVTTTYYVTVSGDGVCANAVGTAKEVTVTVNPKAVATDITVADAAICAGETATLTATSTVVNPIFTWYSDASLTTEISTGSTYDANPTVTTTYYVTVSGDGICANAVGTAKEVTVTVNPKAVATDITIADAAICAGETATLTASSTVVNPIFTWYSDASLTTEISTGSTYDAYPTVTTTYYVTVSGDGVCANAVGTAKEVTVTVNPKAIATDIIVADAAICAGETAILTATSTIVNPIFTWYSDASLTTEISTGSTYDANPTVTTTYYITVSGDGVCANAVGTAKEVTVTVGMLGTPTTNNVNQEFCIDTNPTIGNIQVNESNVIWYDAITGGNMIALGTPLVSGQTYYAALHDPVGGCESAIRLAIHVVIKTNTPGSITGWDNVACVLNQVTYTTSVGMTDYHWVVTGGIIVSGGHSTDNFVTVMWPTVTDGEIEVSFINANNCDPLVIISFPITVQSCSDMSIEKVVNVLEPEIGDNVIFTITVKNNGTGKFEHVIVSELLPTGYQFVSAIPSIGDYVATTGIWSIPELDVGEHVTLTVTATVLQSGNYLNIASIIGSNPEDSNPDNNQAQAKVEPVELVIYNGVSPNGDGLNDYFYIRGLEKYPNNTVEIYNRWGVKVFSAKGYGSNNKVFRGVSDGYLTVNKGNNVSSSTYFYIIRYVTHGGERVEKSGYLYVN
ncbi:gliding motility-associated C-terminal domain-containing protein [Flavobacterium sp. '19STA2R22 D10 B1']|uniref:Ig-like domain-containing protein n=1 Tax=Flavobacterium aerium TaxID=3037261 RepID=UPI00278BCA59|nr:gliding motility-associated C-terminal domain-containing protein [Flavobacterium sp. '19STA2R22 D10 B1']